MVEPKSLKVWKKFGKKATLISIKNTTNFVSTTFLYDDFLFLTVLLIAVKLKFSDAPHAQDNLSKLLTVRQVRGKRSGQKKSS